MSLLACAIALRPGSLLRIFPLTKSELIVVKVGGSLLLWKDLRKAMHRWLEVEKRSHAVFIAGGGPLADCIREADQIHQMGEEPCHDLCVELLGVTSRLLAQISGLPVTSDFKRVSQRATSPPVVFDPAPFLKTGEPGLPGALPRNWSVTTDSIAARIAQLVQADELVLLKSATAPAGHSLEQLAEAGFVDNHFPLIAPTVAKYRFVNLREL